MNISRRTILKSSAGAVAAATLTQSLRLPAWAAGPGLAGVALGDTPQDVIRKRGIPQNMLFARGSGVPEWIYPGVVVRFASLQPALQTVKSVHIIDATGGPSEFGLRVGSAVTDLLRVYGGRLSRYANGAGYYLDISPAVRLDFVTVANANDVVAIVLSDRSCTSCQALTGTPGPKKKYGQQRRRNHVQLEPLQFRQHVVDISHSWR